MKKIVMYVLILVIITFIIPFFFTKVKVESNSLIIQTVESNEDNKEPNDNLNVDTTPYNYKEYNN